MKQIIGVTFVPDGKISYYLVGNHKVKKGFNVIVKTERGLEFAKAVTDIHPIDTSKLKEKLPEVVRIATKEDFKIHKENKRLENEAMKYCQKLAKKYKLDMDIMNCSYTLNKDQMMFKFYSENRIDFRNLAKELAKVYKTRIELRQIGVRDKAKEIGGYGSCGQPLCCKRFLKDFDSVSISMAKDQNLSLNPTKINGLCGRLLCCLKYENECYKKCQKGLPSVGKSVEYDGNTGKVISVDILNRKYKLLLPNGNIQEVELCDKD